MKASIGLAVALLACTPAWAGIDTPPVNYTAGTGISVSAPTISATITPQQMLSAKTISISSTGDKATLTVPAYITKYSVGNVWVTNCSGTPVLAQLALYTGAAQTGTNVVAAATITAATSTSAIVPMTVTGVNTALTSGSLFVNVAVANIAAVTCDVYAVLNNLS